MPMSVAALYEMAERRKIPVYSFPFKKLPSLSIMDDDGDCAIGLQNELRGPQEHVCLAHEMGHCLTGAFYRRTTSGAVRGKCEYKADKWAFYRLVPPTVLEKLLIEDSLSVEEIAEHFDVTIDFLLRAMDYYACVKPMK